MTREQGKKARSTGFRRVVLHRATSQHARTRNHSVKLRHSKIRSGVSGFQPAAAPALRSGLPWSILGFSGGGADQGESFYRVTEAKPEAALRLDSLQAALMRCSATRFFAVASSGQRGERYPQAQVPDQPRRVSRTVGIVWPAASAIDRTSGQLNCAMVSPFSRFQSTAQRWDTTDSTRSRPRPSGEGREVRSR